MLTRNIWLSSATRVHSWTCIQKQSRTKKYRGHYRHAKMARCNYRQKNKQVNPVNSQKIMGFMEGSYVACGGASFWHSQKNGATSAHRLWRRYWDSGSTPDALSKLRAVKLFTQPTRWSQLFANDSERFYYEKFI